MLKKILLLLSILPALCLAPAADASGFRKLGCRLTGFEYDSARIVLTCSNDPVTYYGFAGAQACSVEIDTLKVWASMLQGQMLANRAVEMWINDPTTCAGVHVLGSVKMLP